MEALRQWVAPSTVTQPQRDRKRTRHPPDPTRPRDEQRLTRMQARMLRLGGVAPQGAAQSRWHDCQFQDHRGGGTDEYAEDEAVEERPGPAWWHQRESDQNRDPHGNQRDCAEERALVRRQLPPRALPTASSLPERVTRHCSPQQRRTPGPGGPLYESCRARSCVAIDSPVVSGLRSVRILSQHKCRTHTGGCNSFTHRSLLSAETDPLRLDSQFEISRTYSH